MNNSASDLSSGNYFSIQRLGDGHERSAFLLTSLREKRIYDIVWVTEGSVALITGNTSTNAHSNAVWFLGPGKLKKLYVENTGKGLHLSMSAGFLCSTGGVCNFSFFSGKHALNTEPVAISVDTETEKDVKTTLLKLEQEFNNVLSFRQEIIKSLFQTFLLYMSRHYTAKSFSTVTSRDAIVLDGFFQLLQNSFRVNKKVCEYAIKLNLTPNYLNQIVKKLTGFTASHYIRQQIILEARKRALDPHCSMKEVAYGLGFDSMAHFSKFFKVNSGSNFSMFRKDVFNLAS